MFLEKSIISVLKLQLRDIYVKIKSEKEVKIMSKRKKSKFQIITIIMAVLMAVITLAAILVPTLMPFVTK